MKPQQIYAGLKEVAEKLEIRVSEQNLRISGIPVRSGLCKVHDQWVFVMDRYKNIHQKNRILGSALAALPIDDLYILPAIREFIERQAPDSKQADLFAANPEPDHPKPPEGTISFEEME